MTLEQSPSPHFLDKFDAPSLWGTVGMMGSTILNMEQEQSDSIALHPQDIERIILDLYQSKFEAVEDKRDQLQTTLITVSKHLKSQVL